MLNEVLKWRNEWKKKCLLVVGGIFYEENECFYGRMRKKWVGMWWGNDLEDGKGKIVVFGRKKIMEGVNECRLMGNGIEMEYRRYG